MKLEELKNGNLIKFDSITIKILNKKDSVLDCIEYPIMTPDPENIKPRYYGEIYLNENTIPKIQGIPLTETILLSNPEYFDSVIKGFVNGGELPPSDSVFLLESIKLSRISQHLWKVEFTDNTNNVNSNISFVHELQNIYTELTGKELEIEI